VTPDDWPAAAAIAGAVTIPAVGWAMSTWAGCTTPCRLIARWAHGHPQAVILGAVVGGIAGHLIQTTLTHRVSAICPTHRPPHTTMRYRRTP